MNKNHDDNVPKRVTNLTKAPKPAPNAKKNILKCPKCDTKCSDNDVLKKHMTREHSPKNVWTISSNLNTKELDDLIEEEEELALDTDKIEHDIVINASAAEWHAGNFNSTFSNSGEFGGIIASTLTVLDKCSECETNSKTIENQRILLSNLDKQIQDSHKSQRDSRNLNKDMKKKLDEAIKVVEETVAENANMKEELQVQKDLFWALKLKIGDRAPKEAENYVKIVENEEGPLPEGQRKCEKCKFTSTNRVIMKAHEDAYHKAIPKYSCLMCGSIAANLESYEKHKNKHNKELSVGSTNKYPMNVYTFKCKPCKLSFRNHDTLIDHMASVYVPERKRQLKESSYEEGEDVQHCRNGDQCFYHKQHRCNYFHALPPPVQSRRFSKQSPDSQWRTVQNRRPRYAGLGEQQRQELGEQQKHGHGDQQWQGPDQQWHGQPVQELINWGGSRDISTPWCRHVHNCLQSRFYVLRNYSDQDFTSQPFQGRH